METTPASRLPGVDSLPAGFVDSSGDSPPAAYHGYKKPLLDVDQPILAGGPAEPATPLGYAINPPEMSVGRDFWNSGRGSEGFLELYATRLKERSVAENGYLENQKLGIFETNHRLVNYDVKQQKEFLEFTFMYQKALAERDAAVAVRERLVSLCRELQHQNKLLLDECLRASTEGQSLRLDLSLKFNDVIKDIGNKLEEQKGECLNQLKENEMLRGKLKHLSDQNALSEQHFAVQLKEKTLELQLADLKLQQQKDMFAQGQTQLQLYVEQVKQLLDTEKNLRLQLAADAEKFQQFQEGLLKSNDMFDVFKDEMELVRLYMTKFTKNLKKENGYLKNKCDESDMALAKLVEDRELMKKQLEKVKNQKERLESLCRSLQADRKQLTSELRNSNSVPMCDQVGHAEEGSQN